MAFKPHKFGRYIIVDPIAVGGMAEIYRARLAAAKEGPDRIIVIKKVIANLSQNSEFISMFEEEIKITVGLTHPNIIQIYDYGKVEEQYFMAMEYVEGKNLRQFVKRLADMKSMFSIDMSCYIISQICHALAYAHAFKDRMSGKSLGIVHRDISPQNIMISYDGAVKLFDFGIAKAKSASEATRAGVIKGKPSYLSPEQINGEELDGRCDIFALGIVLWELLTAKRLFVADTDMGVLRLIQSAKIEPPSTFNPAVPQGLDTIVLKSLARDKSKRYQGAEEFQRDLHKFLYSFNSSFNPADLSYYAQELFKNEIREDRDRLQKALSIQPVDDGESGPQNPSPGKAKLSNKLADGLISTTDFNREMMDNVVAQNTGSFNAPKLEVAGSSPIGSSTGSASSVPRPPVPGGAPKIPGTQVNTRSNANIVPPKKGATDGMVIPPWSKPGSGGTMARRSSGTQTALSREMTRIEKSSASRNTIMVLLGVLVVAVFGAREAGMLCGGPLSALAKDKDCAAEVVPHANTAGNPQEPATGTAEAPKQADGNPGFVDPTGQAPDQQRTPASTGTIRVHTNISGYRVYVSHAGAQGFQSYDVRNNEIVGLPLKTPLFLMFTKVGYETIKTESRLDSPGLAAVEYQPKPVPTGSVEFETSPASKATFFLLKDGKEEQVLDLTNYPTPLKATLNAGDYRIRVVDTILSNKGELTIKVEPNKLNRLPTFTIGAGK
jgi:serine/threonine protein kinase